MTPQFHIAAVILAAGESSSLGQPKQLIQFRGKTLVRHMVDGASEAGCRPVLVVLGNSNQTASGSARGEAREHEIDLVEAISSELKKTGATIVANPNWKRGIGTSIRAGVQQIDSRDVIYSVRTMDEVIAGSLSTRQLAMVLLAVFASLALLLCCIGTYGVISCLVGRRTREIGVRMALGARCADVLRLVLAEGAGMALAGVAAGSAGPARRLRRRASRGR